MKRKKAAPEPTATDQVETLRGDYHYFESTFRPRAKTLPIPRGRPKGRTPAKTPRKRTK